MSSPVDLDFLIGVWLGVAASNDNSLYFLSPEGVVGGGGSHPHPFQKKISPPVKTCTRRGNFNKNWQQTKEKTNLHL